MKHFDLIALLAPPANFSPKCLGRVGISLLLVGLSACAPRSLNGDGPGMPPLIRSTGGGSSGGPARISDTAEETKKAPIIHLADGSKAEAGPQTLSTADVTAGGDVTLRFVNADIRTVLQSVLGDILGLSYTIHPKVEGTITVQTSRPLKREDVLPTLEQVLQANEIAVVQSDGIYQVVPLALAGSGGAVSLPVSTGGKIQPGMSATVVRLKFASANQLLKVLEPFVPAGGVVQADTARNLLIVSGGQAQIQSFMRLINVFDVDWLAGTSFGLFPLEQGTASGVAKELATILDASQAGSLSGIVRVVPIDRINAVLVTSTQPAYISQVQAWIERLDKGWDETLSRIYVYHVQNSRAADLAKVLDGMFAGGGTQTVRPETMPGSTITEIGSGMATGGLAAGARGAVASVAQSPIAAPETGASDSQAAGGAATRGAGAADNRAGATVTPIAPASASPGPGEAAAATRIVADEKNNALVVYAKPREYRMIEGALKKLDVLPLQIMIEATIAEVTLTDDLKYGLQWFFQSGNSQFTLSNLSSGAVNPVFPGFGYVFQAPSAKAVLSALSSVTRVNVLSAPQLMVLDHQTATLQVGDEVPVALQQARSVTNPDAPIVNSIGLRSTGVILKVTPRVNANGVATLSVDQEVSDVATTTTSNIDSPTIKQRRISSVVAVDDGDTIALGGLIRDNRTLGKDGLPILSDIPVFGGLFSTKRDDRTRTELLILLTPRVVRNRIDAQRVTDELARRMDELRFAPISK